MADLVAAWMLDPVASQQIITPREHHQPDAHAEAARKHRVRLQRGDKLQWHSKFVSK
jgi:hypothetical protein